MSIPAIMSTQLKVYCNHPEYSVVAVFHDNGSTKVYDPATSQMVGTAHPDRTCRVLIAPYSTNGYDDEHVDGTSILSGDMKCVVHIDSLTWIPDATSTLFANGKRYKIVNASAIRVGETVIGHKYQVRS